MNGAIGPYLRLARVDRPVGTLLLLWPTLAALWIAAAGPPPPGILAAFVAGTFLARSAGCVINDIADRGVDGEVARTRDRPLATGEVSVRDAWIFLAVLCAVCVGVVLTLHPATRPLAAAGAAVAAIYPFLKRWTHFPQAVLGVAFSWGIPMAFAAVNGHVDPRSWLLFAASFAWIVGYDTLYAMVDRDDDVRIGVKSTAVLFGAADRAAVAVLQAVALVLLILTGLTFGFAHGYFAGVVAAGAFFAWQQWLIRNRDPAACFRAFGNNAWVGFALFAGAVAEFAFPWTGP